MSLLVLVCCYALVAGAALAQVPAEKQLPPEKLDEAKRYVDKAQQHYALAEFPEAVEQFKAAYRIVPRAVILFNLGQCYLQMRDYARAEFSYRAYLRADPNAENRAAVEELLEQAVGAQREAAALVEAAAAPSPLPSPAPPPPSARPAMTAGLVALALGTGGCAGAGGLALALEGALATDVGDDEARTSLFWLEKGLAAGAVVGLVTALVGGALLAASPLIE